MVSKMVEKWDLWMAGLMVRLLVDTRAMKKAKQRVCLKAVHLVAPMVVRMVWQSAYLTVALMVRKSVDSKVMNLVVLLEK